MERGAQMSSKECWDNWREARDAYHAAVKFAESYSVGDRSATKNLSELRHAMNMWARQAQALEAQESGEPAQNARVLTATFRGTLE